MTDHVTRPTLRDLTGTPIVARQLRWLDAHGWPYVLDTHGRPKVAVAVYEIRMGIRTAPAPESSAPDWSKLLPAGAVVA